MHTHEHVHVCARMMCATAPMHAHVQKCAHTCTNAHTRAQMHTHVDKCKQMHTHLHKITHLHTPRDKQEHSRAMGPWGCQACASPAPRCAQGAGSSVGLLAGAEQRGSERRCLPKAALQVDEGAGGEGSAKGVPCSQAVLLKWSAAEQSGVLGRRALAPLGTAREPPARRAAGRVAKPLAVLPLGSPLCKLDDFLVCQPRNEGKRET